MTLLNSLPPAASAVGGKWTPEQILEHDPAWLRQLGLELAPKELWDPASGGLLEAIVQMGGCSSGFISEHGLLVTNHHCAFGMLQEHSSPERDLIADGFVAKDRSEELVGATARATVPHRFTDVTAEIEAAASRARNDSERFRAIDRKKKELVANCEKQDFRRCRVATYDDGVRYVLIEALEFRDLRLVFTPPSAIGEYGGDVDNWMWPRHTGDFALLRVYAGPDNQPAAASPDNKPYRPRRHLSIARENVDEGDFVMVVGYPGGTYRSLVAEEMAERAQLYYPRRSALFQHWMGILKEASSKSDATSIVLAGRFKGLANNEKNARGQVGGITRGQLLEKKRELEKKVLAWAAARKDHQQAMQAHEELSRIVAEQRKTTWDRDFLLQQMSRGPVDLDLAVRLTRWALERAKPDMERHETYQERYRENLLNSQKRDQKRLHPPTEKHLLQDLLERFAALPEGQKVSAMETLSSRPAAKAVHSLLTGTKIHDLAERLEMFEESVEELRARQDPMLDFAFALNQDILAMEHRHDARDGAVSRLRPAWRQTVQAYLGKPLDPDANGTLRVSLAEVRGYRPRDGVWMEPRTRVAGVMEKHTGEDPFDAPAVVREGAPHTGDSRWADPQTGDVPVCFLATGDTTGGSSGSPVLNGRGELVGVNFDRVWENIANDFGYNPAIARNVSVDVRYMLWILERTGGPGPQSLLRELGLRE